MRQLRGALAIGLLIAVLVPVYPATATSDASSASATATSGASGAVWAWGDNRSGSIPVEVSGLSGVVAVDASSSGQLGEGHSLALKSDGTLWAWGDNRAGQLGDGTTTDRSTPVQVVGLEGVVGMSAGLYHSLAVKSDGTLWAWGDNSAGQLGDGTTTHRSTPVQVVGLEGVVDISAGVLHSLAVKSDGTLWAWGDNSAGQLGDGTFGDDITPTPIQVSGLSGVVAAETSFGYSLALKSDGTLWAWGNNQGERSLTPVQVVGLGGVVDMSAGQEHSLALKSDGTVCAWGNGTLGNGTWESQDRKIPVRVWGLTDVASIAAGGSHSLAVKSDGTVWAWGSNTWGQLGTTVNQKTAVQVSGLSGAVSVAAGGSFSLAVTGEHTPRALSPAPACDITRLASRITLSGELIWKGNPPTIPAIRAAGRVRPGREGTVNVALQARKGGRWRTTVSKRVVLNSNSAFRATLTPPPRSYAFSVSVRCRLRARFPGDSLYQSGKKTMRAVVC